MEKDLEKSPLLPDPLKSDVGEANGKKSNCCVTFTQCLFFAAVCGSIALLGYSHGGCVTQITQSGICPYWCPQMLCNATAPVPETALSDPQKEERRAGNLSEGDAVAWLKSTGYGTVFQFAEMTGVNTTLKAALQQQAYSSILVIVPSLHKPVRRDRDTPFFTLLPSSPLEPYIPVNAINKAAEVLEGVLGRRLFPFRVDVRDLGYKGVPYVFWDASQGLVVLDTHVVAKMHELPVAVKDTITEFTSSIATQLSRYLGYASNSNTKVPLTNLLEVASKAAATAVGVAVVFKIPLWFCIACPTVLGMLFPFVFNIGLGRVAQALCDAYTLPSDECNELWIGAIMVAMVLSFASVVPIVRICRLAECAKPS